MLYRFYIYDQQILLPTVAETEEGFYVDTKPVERLPVTQLDEWKSKLYQALAAGNKVIPTPEQHDTGGSALLELLNLQKWATFEKRAVMYTVHRGSGYIRIYRTGKGSDGMWDSTINERVFDIRSPLQLIVDSLASDVIKQPEAHPVKSGGLMILPPDKPKIN